MQDASQPVAIVTGAAQGIGKSVAAQLGRDGYAVVISDLREDAAEATASTLASEGLRTIPCASDVSNPDDCRRMVERAVSAFGRVDVLVNSAGISKPGPSLDVTPDDWNRMIGVQLNGTFFSCQAAGRQIVGQGWGGAIVNITSIGAQAAFPQRASYASAKAAVDMLTKVLAIEWAQYNIRVNAVGPAHTETEMTQRLVEQGLYSLDSVKRRIPLGRLAQVQDVANAVSFLVSERASFITGHALYVDGGYLAYGYW